MSGEWLAVAGRDDVPDGEVVAVTVRGHDVALYGVEGEVYATDNVCTHGHARLCDGFLEGHEIECPLHQGRFDVRSGQPTCAPATEAVRVYPVKIEGGRVWLALG